MTRSEAQLIKENQTALRQYFMSLPVYTPVFKETVEAVVASITDYQTRRRGAVIEELTEPTKDFWFLKSGFLREMYTSQIQSEDALFNLIPPGSIFVNEDTLITNLNSKHYYVAYEDVEILRFPFKEYQKLNKKYPLLQLLYLSGTAEIQRNRRSRLIMLRMNKTIDKVQWVRKERPDLYRFMDRVTLSQYIGVSRASLYRAFDKNDKFQF